MKSVTILRKDNETMDQFWIRYEKKLKELDHQSVNIRTNSITINYK